MTDKQIREFLIRKGVVSIRRFGYPSATVTNILDDRIYKPFFKRMLEDSKGEDVAIDKVIDSLLKELA